MEELKNALDTVKLPLDNTMVIAVNVLYALVGVLGLTVYGKGAFNGLKLKFGK